VARQAREKWRTTVLDTGESESPLVPALWSAAPGEYQDVYGEKKIRASRPVIVFCRYEAWAILYAWTGKTVTKIQLAD
jgi:hypothetical protein